MAKLLKVTGVDVDGVVVIAVVVVFRFWYFSNVMAVGM